MSVPAPDPPDDVPADLASRGRRAVAGASGGRSTGIRSGRLAGRSMASAILILATPILVQQTLQACVGMADKVFAGRLADDIRVPAMDAIGIGSYVGWFIGIAMAGLGAGGQALIARGMGAGDRALSHRALGQSMALSITWGVIVGALLWIAAEPLAVACRLSDEGTRLYLVYIRTIAAAMPAAGVLIVGAMCLHGAGETMKPAGIAVWENIINVLLSWALSGVDISFGEGAGRVVLENPFPFDLGVQGIALGTAGGYLFGALLTLRVLCRGVRDLRLTRTDLRFDRVMTRRVVRLGIPNFLEGISMWAVNLFVLMMIGAIAAARTASEGLQGAHIIAVQWEAFSFLPGFAIGTAAGALAGQYLGAGDPDRAQRAVIVCAVIASLLMGAFGIVFMVFGRELTAIMSTEPVHLDVAPRLLMICGAVQVFFAIAMVVRQGLRGVGDARWTLVITSVSSYCVRLPAAWILGIALDLGMDGIWYALCGEFIVRAALFATRFFHGGWKRIMI
ncbi:MAG: MATE family efflux transporter [Phycisphaeraceae bacterium]|nr:MATE family efflux transporter [Phycisphaeraceae bacterium]